MKVILWVCGIALTLGLLSGCSEPATLADRHRIEALRSEFQGRYQFHFDSRGIYLNMTALESTTPSREDAIRTVREFWLENGAKRTDSSFVYLNVYNTAGRFEKQFYWDSKTAQVETSDTEHY